MTKHGFYPRPRELRFHFLKDRTCLLRLPDAVDHAHQLAELPDSARFLDIAHHINTAVRDQRLLQLFL